MVLLQEGLQAVHQAQREAELRDRPKEITSQMFSDAKNLLDKHGKRVRRIGVFHLLRPLSNVLDYLEGQDRLENQSLNTELTVDEKPINVLIDDRWSMRGERNGLNIRIQVEGVPSYLTISQKDKTAHIVHSSGKKELATIEQAKEYRDVLNRVQVKLEPQQSQNHQS